MQSESGFTDPQSTNKNSTLLSNLRFCKLFKFKSKVF